MDLEEQRTLIENCKKRSEKLDDWEIKFIDSISRQIDEGSRLTERQLDKLNEIWERVNWNYRSSKRIYDFN